MDEIIDVSDENTDMIQLINIFNQFNLIKFYQYKDCRVVYSIDKCNSMHISASSPYREVSKQELAHIFSLLTDKPNFEYLKLERGIYLIEKKKEECSHNCEECGVDKVDLEVIENVKINAIMQNKISDYDTYGLTRENPIYACMPSGSKRYLSHLRTEKGERLTYKLLYCTSSDNVAGLIDVYQLYLNNRPYKQLYINMYCPENSKVAPKGFIYLYLDPRLTNKKKF